MELPADWHSVEIVVAGVSRAHQDLLDAIRELSANDLDSPSLLPGWRRREVLAHLAANATGVQRVLDGVHDGQILVKYPGEGDARQRTISHLATLSAPDLLKRVAHSARELEATMSSLAPEEWGRPTRQREALIPAWRAAWFRWLEVEVHHLDLVLGREPADLPTELVAQALSLSARDLPGRLPAGTEVELAVEGGVSPESMTDGRSPDLVVRGASHDILWWLLRPERAEHERLSVRDRNGRPAELPPLTPWG